MQQISVPRVQQVPQQVRNTLGRDIPASTGPHIPQDFWNCARSRKILIKDLRAVRELGSLSPVLPSFLRLITKEILKIFESTFSLSPALSSFLRLMAKEILKIFEVYEETLL